MTESFPRQEARTRRFSLGVPRAFRISPDGARVVFLRTQSGADPVTCLWALDVASGQERLVADPRTLGPDRKGTDEDDLPPQERARRERVREQAGGIVAYATDQAVTVAVFALSGQVYAVPLTGAGTGQRSPAYRVATRTPAVDPRPDPAGRRLAYVCDGALRVSGLRGRPSGPGGRGPARRARGDVRAARVHRGRGNGPPPRLLVGPGRLRAARRAGGRDPGHPVAHRRSRAPRTGARRGGLSRGRHPERRRLPASWPASTAIPCRCRPIPAAFPYLVTAGWQDGHDPLVVVQSRDQRAVRILGVDVASGQTRVLHEDTDPVWLEIVPGVPAWTADGRIVWTRDEPDTRRLVLLAPGRSPEVVTPPGLQVRGVLDVDGDTVLFQASGQDPAEVGLWSYGPSGLHRAGAGGGVEAGTRAGGTTVTSRRALDADGVTVRVSRGGSRPAVDIASLAEPPALPAPDPVLFRAGPREIQTAVLFPSWHQAGQYRSGRGRLPVLLDPYGGPHAQRVLRARGAYLVPQWFAEQGFAVVIADGRGTPARGQAWERAVAGDLADPVLEDQVDALAAAADRFADLDTGRVAIRGWSFGGYLAALAVLRRPDVFHAAIAGAPVTDWRLYDTHYTERYLGLPGSNAEAYDRSSLINLAERSVVSPRPLMLIHGLADDNVVVAHTLRLSAALLAAGYPHQVLPLTGITHMASQEAVAENLLLLQLDFLLCSLFRAV